MIAASASSLEAMIPDSERLDDASGPLVHAEGLHHTDPPRDTTRRSMWSPVEAYVRIIEREASDGPTGKVSSALQPIAMSLKGALKHAGAEHLVVHGRGQKRRGKLSSSRRQEVQNMRKQGACIRCRMLRKTVGLQSEQRLLCDLLVTDICQCSGDTPCKTCAAVASARVWKLDCIRTSIMKEFELYHTSN